MVAALTGRLRDGASVRGSIVLCLSPSTSPLGAGRAAAGPLRGGCWGARCGTCLALRLVRWTGCDGSASPVLCEVS